MCTLVEWIDPCGMRVVGALLANLRNRPTLTQIEAARIRFLEHYLQAVDATYGPATTGPLGFTARPLRCTYMKVRDGRMYCRTKHGPEWSDGQSSYVCAQGMPSALRPYLMHKWAHDFDIENCHVVLMYQLGKYYHMWPEHNGRGVPLHLPMLESLATARDKFIVHIAITHNIDDDASRYPGYRKDVCKSLLLRILYGGSYDSWMHDNNLFVGNRCKKVDALQQEMRTLRTAVLSSKRFEYIVASERTIQQRRGKSKDAIERGVFSKVAQYLENIVLAAMVEYLYLNKWTVLSLVFDGLIVEHRIDARVDTEAMARFVELSTQFSVRIVEKSLFRFIPRQDSLLR